MAVRTGLWVNSRVDTADARAGVFGLLTSEGATSLWKVRNGVLLDTDYPLAVGTAAGVNDVSVKAGVAVFGRAGMVGAYTVANDSSFTLTLPAPPATDKRIDSIYIGQPDVDAGDADSTEVITYVSGAVSATPTAPAVPAYAVRLADVTRTAGDTAITSGMIADKRVWTVPRRAIGYVPSTDLATVRSKARDGEINWAPDKGAHYTVVGAGEAGSGTWERLWSAPRQLSESAKGGYAGTDGELIWNTTKRTWEYWESSGWSPAPGSRITVGMLTTPAPAAGTLDIGSFTFTMPRVAGARTVRVRFRSANLEHGTAPTVHDAAWVAIDTASASAVREQRGRRRLIVHGVYGSDYHDGIDVHVDLGNSTHPVGETVTAYLRLSVPTGTNTLRSVSYEAVVV